MNDAEGTDYLPMTKIDFYVLNSGDSGKRFMTACRIAEKAYLLGHRVHIHTDSNQLSGHMDDLLWTFRDRSFVPHAIEPQQSSEWPVTIGHGWVPDACEVLVNLSQEVPAFFSRFERVAEIVDQSHDVKDRGRARYGFYRDRGYPLDHHRLEI